MIFPGEKNPITLKSYIISPDKTYNKDSDYRIITHKSLGDVRFWERDVYYTTNFTPIDIKEVTQEKIDEGFLFVLNSETGRYTRAKGALNTEENYYKPGNFINNDINYDPKKTYFELNKVIENNIIYVQVIDYISVGKINEIEFNYRPYYVFINNIYYEAEEYEENTTYYIKKVTLKQYEDTGVITASDLNEVTLIDFNSTPGCCQYIPKGSGETGEYIVITAKTAKYFKDNIVQITVTNELEIYIPNFYYYLIEDDGDPLKGSVVFDNNPIKSEDRIYYKKDNVRVEGLVDYNKTKPYKPSEYYYEVNGEYILDTSLAPTPDRHYYLKNGLYVMSDTTGLFPVGSEWNINVPKPSTITLGTRTNIWRLQELKGFARHYNTVHGLVLRLNNILEDNNSLTRDLSNIQGIINKVRDLFVKFDEMRPNEILVTNKLGRITTTGLKGDNWINTEYSNDSKITITHKYNGEDSGKGNHAVSGESIDKTLEFGGTFTSPSFSFSTDDMGHVNEFSTSNKTITMPILEFTEGESNANVVTNMTMSDGSGFNKITFTETRDYIGNLALNGYSIGNAEGSVSASDSLNKALGLIEYKLGAKTVSNQIDAKINALDVTSVGGDTYYLSAISEADGKISATAKTIDTSIDSTSVNTAVVSPKAVYDYLANTYKGTNNITTLGSITDGTWNATPITTDYIDNSAITTDKINDGAVTAAKIYNGAVTNDKIASGIDASKLTTGTLPVDRIADGSITNAKIISLDASKITGILSIDRITDGSIMDAKLASGIAASKINGTLSTDNIPNISATKITADTLSIDRIPDLDSNKITSGILSVDRIPELSASKITSDVLAVDRIPNLSGAKILLTDYKISEKAKDPLTTKDTVNSAFAKLEKRIKDLEEAQK